MPLGRNKVRLAQRRNAAAESIQRRLEKNVIGISRKNPVERPYTDTERATLTKEYQNIMVKLH